MGFGLQLSFIVHTVNGHSGSRINTIPVSACGSSCRFETPAKIDFETVLFGSASKFSLASPELAATLRGSRFQAIAPKTAFGKKSLPALIRLRIIPNIDSSGERG